MSFLRFFKCNCKCLIVVRSVWHKAIDEFKGQLLLNVPPNKLQYKEAVISLGKLQLRIIDLEQSHQNSRLNQDPPEKNKDGVESNCIESEKSGAGDDRGVHDKENSSVDEGTSDSSTANEITGNPGKQYVPLFTFLYIQTVAVLPVAKNTAKVVINNFFTGFYY